MPAYGEHGCSAVWPRADRLSDRRTGEVGGAEQRLLSFEGGVLAHTCVVRRPHWLHGVVTPRTQGTVER